jgi:hypothetical protein
MRASLILRSQANEVFNAIRQSGLDPTQFAWSTQYGWLNQELVVSRLTHTPSGFYYTFDFSDQGHWAEFSPGEHKVVQTAHPGAWSQQLGYVGLWLTYLKREIEAPDLWAAIRTETDLILAGGTSEQDNAPFTPGERQRIGENLRELRDYARATYQLSADQAQFINARLAYLEEASERVGRKDWLILAAGVLVNIVVGAALAPEAAKDLLRFAGRVLGWLIGAHPLLP